MKNKGTTYALGFVLLAVWGVIIYRIFTSISGNDDDFQPIDVKQVKEAYNDYTVPKDTSRLLLNYRDPFGIKKEKDTTEISVKKILAVRNPQPAAKPQAMNWNFIRYSGYIRNPGSKNLIALMSINGRPVEMTEGQTQDQVKLLKNLEDSVKITFNGKTTYIKIHSGGL